MYPIFAIIRAANEFADPNPLDGVDEPEFAFFHAGRFDALFIVGAGEDAVVDEVCCRGVKPRKPKDGL